MKKSLYVVLLAVFALGLAGCEETIDPFIEDNRFYTVWGYLDTASNTQFIRIEALRRTLGLTDDGAIDAIVTTTAREDGNTVVWRDSLITFDDGSIGTVFYAPFRPIPGWTYDLVIERSDGARSEAFTTVPPAPGVQIEDPRIVVTSVTQDITWPSVDAEPFRVEVWYRFLGNSPRDPFTEAVVVYDEDEFGEFVDGGWRVRVDFIEDRFDVAEILGVAEDTRLPLLGVGVRLTMTDDAWRPPGGVFDPEILVQPGTFSNVNNGFGFFGAVNQYTTEWTLTETITERIGYGVPRKR